MTFSAEPPCGQSNSFKTSFLCSIIRPVVESKATFSKINVSRKVLTLADPQGGPRQPLGQRARRPFQCFVRLSSLLKVIWRDRNNPNRYTTHPKMHSCQRSAVCCASGDKSSWITPSPCAISARHRLYP